MDDQVPVFTASRIAEMVGQDRKTVREQLGNLPSSQVRTVQVNGQAAQAWHVSDIPPALLARLADFSDEHCFGRDNQGIEKYLANGRPRWSPRTPAGRLPQAQIDIARKRCSALAAVLRQQYGQPISNIVETALPAWETIGGYEVSERTMRRWIERAIARDLDFQEWDRWEIYLDSDLLAVAATPQTAAAQLLATPKLEEMIACVLQPAALTKKEREQIWAAAMNDASVLIDAGSSENDVQRAITKALHLSGLSVGKNLDALRKNYTRKRVAWLAGGGRIDALKDKRESANRTRRFSLPTSDILKLIELARTYSNQLSYAYRVAHRRGLLSAETLARFPALPREKSFVPHSIRKAVAPFLGAIEILGQGPRARRLNGAHVVCDWSNVEPGDVFEFDDLTLPLYWWIEDPSVERGYYFGQGQVLMGVDSKTGYILSWRLVPRAGYNARDIICVVRSVHDAYGLPAQYILFECGIWKRSRLISGEPSERDSNEICGGLASLWPVRHAFSPTGKSIIERTFGLLQDRMEHVPGYVGRDMRKDCPEASKMAIAAVNAGQKHPSTHFLHHSQVMDLLEEIAEAVNTERLGIRTVRIPGKSPKEAFDARDMTRMQYFGPESSHLFKTHRLERKVTIEGVRLPDSLVPQDERPAIYRGPATAELIGQKVLCWFDPLERDSMFITDLDGKNPRILEPVTRPAARGADSESLARAKREGAEQMRVVDLFTRATKSKLTLKDFRPVSVDGSSRRFAADMQEQKDAFATLRREQVSLSSEFDRLTRDRGLEIPKPIEPDRLRVIINGLNADGKHWNNVAKCSQENVEL